MWCRKLVEGECSCELCEECNRLAVAGRCSLPGCPFADKRPPMSLNGHTQTDELDTAIGDFEPDALALAGDPVAVEPTRVRRRDELFDALVEVCGIDPVSLTRSGRGEPAPRRAPRRGCDPR